MKKEVIIAMDFPDKAGLLNFLDQFDQKLYLKLGMEIFYREGPSIVREVKERGHKIFLDLKLHDIPNTVKSAMRNLACLDVDMVNLHAVGGLEMMKAGLEGLEEGAEKSGLLKRPELIAVTQLTSISQEIMNDELGIDGKIEDRILSYASLTKKAGLDGVVCSPLESKLIHDNLGQEFLTVTPGIRFKGQDRQDQKRVCDPHMAGQLGSSYIVMGRAITGADDPVSALKRAVAEFEGGACGK